MSKLRQKITAFCVKKMQKYGPSQVKILGQTYFLNQDVFNPKYYLTSKFMAENLSIKPKIL